MSVSLDGQWLLPATSPHANRLLPPGHGLPRREPSIVPALPPALVVVAAAGAATFLKETRRANGLRNSVTAGSRHGDPRGVLAQAVSPRPALGPQRCPQPGWPRPGGPSLTAQGGSPTALPGLRVPLRLTGTAPGARGAACGRESERVSCASVLPWRCPGRLRWAGWPEEPRPCGHGCARCPRAPGVGSGQRGDKTDSLVSFAFPNTYK